MKRFAVYLLILVLFSTDNTFKEFLKAPFLVGHFIAHQQKDPSIGFLKFMSMHYFGKDQNDNDQNEDMKLPFKKISHAAPIVLFQSPESVIQLPERTCTVIRKPVYQKVFFKDPCADQLYRPPQLKIQPS